MLRVRVQQLERSTSLVAIAYDIDCSTPIPLHSIDPMEMCHLKSQSVQFDSRPTMYTVTKPGQHQHWHSGSWQTHFL